MHYTWLAFSDLATAIKNMEAEIVHVHNAVEIRLTDDIFALLKSSAESFMH